MGKLELIVGCMFSGKTEKLRDKIHRERFRYEHTDENPTVPLFKPAIDVRYGLPTEMVSHNDTKTPCISITSSQDILTYLSDHPEVRLVGIDEIQFLDGSVIDVCTHLTRDRDIDVLASGLNLDFRGELFTFRDSSRTMGDLLGYAQLIFPTSAYCAYIFPKEQKRCHRDAFFTQRLFTDGKPVPYQDPLVVVGGKHVLHERRYEARCDQHHQVPGRPSKSL